MQSWAARSELFAQQKPERKKGLLERLFGWMK
jgi:hypothetical protein